MQFEDKTTQHRCSGGRSRRRSRRRGLNVLKRQSGEREQLRQRHREVVRSHSETSKQRNDSASVLLFVLVSKADRRKSEAKSDPGA